MAVDRARFCSAEQKRAKIKTAPKGVGAVVGWRTVVNRTYRSKTVR